MTQLDTGSIRQSTAGRALVCLECGGSVAAGDQLGQPTTRNPRGGRKFVGFWYCVPCATDLQNLCGKHSGARFFSTAEAQAEKDRRAPFCKRLRERKKGTVPE
jgi:hypothetical protein